MGNTVIEKVGVRAIAGHLFFFRYFLPFGAFKWGLGAICCTISMNS